MAEILEFKTKRKPPQPPKDLKCLFVPISEEWINMFLYCMFFNIQEVCIPFYEDNENEIA